MITPDAGYLDVVLDTGKSQPHSLLPSKSVLTIASIGQEVAPLGCPGISSLNCSAISSRDPETWSAQTNCETERAYPM